MEEPDSDNANEIVVYDPLMEHHALHAHWQSGHSLMAFASTDTLASVDQPRDVSQHPIYLHEIHWNREMHSPVARKLVNESRLVFVGVQQQAEISGKPTKSQLLKFSRNYRSILQSCFMELRQKFEGSEEFDEELEKQMQLYSMMELIWSLCEILFIENSPDGTVLIQLVEWCKWHFPVADDYVRLCYNADDYGSPAQHPNYWPAIYTLALQGRTSEVREMLKLHPAFQTQEHDPFASIDELLRKMPIFSYHQSQSTNEFEMKWRHWHDECVKRFYGGDFDTMPNLKTLSRILCGDEGIIQELTELYGSWYQMLISYLYFKNPTISVSELHYHTKAFIDIFGGQSELGPLDRILLAAFKFDVSQVIRECCKHLGTWWLPTHLADLLHYCDLVPLSITESGTNVREHLIVEYTSSLSNFDSFWPVVVDYLSFCGSLSNHYLGLFVQRIPLSSEKKAAKVIRICEKRGLLKEVESICRQMKMKSMQHNRLGTALSWCIKANDSSFAMIIADKMLKEYARTGLFSNIDLIDYLGSSVLMSESLTFLGKYRDFHKLYAAEKFKDAGQLLLNLLMSRKAPLDFWPSLLMDCLPLLERNNLIYDVEETTGLLACLNVLDQKQKIFDSMTEIERENQEKKMKHLRLALTNNLAKAIVS
ncbi:unnamed protein product [Clavelina lepadiformis]|uniref:Nuclear pore complex protein Nup85 n=1 Tax=Clavelina lepadiformis TaxID=159417 RepID=A0ABP0GXL7_CLALP